MVFHAIGMGRFGGTLDFLRVVAGVVAPVSYTHLDVILAVNTLLMQLFTLFSYIMDGFAYAGEALAGRFIGAKNDVGLRKCCLLYTSRCV